MRIIFEVSVEREFFADNDDLSPHVKTEHR